MASVPPQSLSQRSSRDEQVAASSDEASAETIASTSENIEHSDKPEASSHVQDPSQMSNPATAHDEVDASEAEPSETPQYTHQDQRPSTHNPPPLTRSQTSTPVCWICQQDSTEDPPGTEWRSPCPCSLTAHEECLMEWITSKEAPKAGEIAKAEEIKCPQCQAEIKIARPRDLIVIGAEKIQSVAKLMVVPTVVSVVVGCVFSGATFYGINTLHVVFGADGAEAILAPDELPKGISSREPATIGAKILHSFIHGFFGNFYRATNLWDPFLPLYKESPGRWRLVFGLPLVAPALVLSRYRVADTVFAVLPILYLFTRPTDRHLLTQWPPSSGSAFASLPYIRSMYNELYRHAFSDLEAKWDAAVQRKPREGETAEQIAQAQERAGGQDFLADIQMEIHREQIEADANLPVPEPEPQQGNAGDQEPPPEPNQRRVAEGQRVISVSTQVTKAVGALIFPGVAAMAGTFLKAVLPASWTSKSTVNFWGVRMAKKGLLSEQWGRTLVGGCLFVVLKDAVVLYCKWKKARDFGKQRVLDYVGKTRR